MIKHISIKHFKSFKNIETTLANFSILVGANNSGKSNFKQALLLLRALAGGSTVMESLRSSCDTVLNVIYQEKDSKYKNIEFNLDIVLTQPERKLYNYLINIMEQEEDFYIESEKLLISDEKQVNKALILDNKKGKTEYIEFGKTEFSHADFDNKKLAISQLNDVKLHTYFIALRNFFSYMWFFDFDPEAMKARATYEPGKILYHPAGFNIAGTLYNVKEKYPDTFKLIKERLSTIINEVTDINIIKRGEDNSLILLLFEKGKEMPFVPENVSDGVLRTLGIITAILCPAASPPLMFLEEVDKGIHFRRVRDIVGLLQSKIGTERTRQMQVVLTTHNPYLLDLIEAEQLIILERHKGETLMKRLSEMKDKMSIIKPALEEGTPLGEIWFRGTLGGVPPSE